MAMSRHVVKTIGKRDDAQPCCRQASELDFFCGRSGGAFRLDIFDDCSLCEQPFTKVGNVESMSTR